MCKIMDKYMVEVTIKTARKFKASEEQIVREIMQEFHLSEQEAKDAIEKYDSVPFRPFAVAQ